MKEWIKRLVEPIRKDGILDPVAALQKGRVVSRVVDGEEIRWLITNRHDEIQSKQLESGFYELTELRRLRTLLGARRHVVDIGANIGNHMVYFAKFMGACEVVCVEPYAPARDHLLINLALNGVAAGALRIHACAAGKEPGTARLAPPSTYNIGLTKVVADPGGEIEVIMGDEIVGNARVDLLKIDVEGMELDVLRGLSGVLSRQKPAVYVEASLATQEQLKALMIEAGYRVLDESQAYDEQVNLTLVPT